MFAASRDLPKRPTHTQQHTHPLSSADVSIVMETFDRDREKWKLRKIQITLLSELRGLVTIKQALNFLSFFVEIFSIFISILFSLSPIEDVS